MAEITRPTTVSPSIGSTLPVPQLMIQDCDSGEDLVPGDACYIDDDGFIYKAIASGSAAPAAPALSTATTGGTVLAGTYKVVVAYVTAAGTTSVSEPSFITTTGATSTLTVASPAAQTGATAYRAYISAPNGGPMYLQNGAGTAIATPLVLTAPPVTNTATAPTSNGTVGAAAKFRGMALTYAPSGEGVTLPFHLAVKYATNLTAGADLYLSGVTAGNLADSPAYAGQLPIGFVIDAERIYIWPSNN